ncbi:MAG: polyprenyl diphosphate synthase [Oscillospiraceae bacterium]|nr:polyprenyl diphosphate synthase [Oscillospiraceae bacterium]
MVSSDIKNIKIKKNIIDLRAIEEAGNMPEHIAIIMDGNGRWATKRGLPRTFGHAQGAKVFRRIVEYCIKIKVKSVTFYAFSSENWRRPEDEVKSLMKMIDKYLDDFLAKLTKYDVEVKFIGDISKFEDINFKMYMKMKDIQTKTHGKTMKLNIAMNYGGRDEIVNAANRAFKRNGGGVITAEMIEKELHTQGQKDPDLIIRTAGEQRLSNFLLWQCAYSEFWFTDVLWPDFSEKILNEAIFDYSNRKRRYGGI